MKSFYFLLMIFFSMASPMKSQSSATIRSQQWGKGINLSWMDNRWKGTEEEGHRDYLNVNDLPHYKEQIQLIHQLGYTGLRFPVCFDLWYDDEAPYTLLKPQYFIALDSILKWTQEHHMMIIIDNHHGELSSKRFEKDSQKLYHIWHEVSQRYKTTDPDQILFELFNEPHEITAAEWKIVTDSLISIIRQQAPEHTLLIGGSKWNSAQALMEMPLFKDRNILYTFHFYDPFLFTHQGASWVGAPAATTYIPYPYQMKRMPEMAPQTANTWAKHLFDLYPEQANYKALYKSLKKVKSWSQAHHVPVFCGEWGALKQHVDPEDRCRYLGDVYAILDKLNIPQAMWEWDMGFSFFDGALSEQSINPCLKNALHIH